MKRVLPLAALVLLAGCTTQATTSPSATTAAPAGSSKAAATPTSDPGDGEGDGAGGGKPVASPTRTSDPGDGDMLAGLGTDADWKKLVMPCPNAGQKPVVQKVITGDVNRDGTHDALVARSCEAQTSYWPSTVEIFDGASPATSPRRLATLLADVGPDDQPWVVSLRVDGGAVVIKAYGVDEHSNNACPDLTFTYRYRLDGKGAHREQRQVANANKCLPVG
ncbi:hypothetical protein ACQP2F_36920 [Actinoplanes sp. CA-030573]|uniref:hypothetical protein n=1 Tax=Actinoplanes sp. CA-030573 TaxID=3239898 RepID=UPI003D947A09